MLLRSVIIGIRTMEANQLILYSIFATARVHLVVNPADAAYWLVAVGGVGFIYKELVYLPIAGIAMSGHL